MNPYTGELIALTANEKLRDAFEVLPKALQGLAQRKIEFAHKRGESAVVNLRSRSPLAMWAKKKRIAKIAAQSRRRNRHGKR